MADTKPSDLFLGVIEFFAILLPGATLVYLIQPWTADLVPSKLRPDDTTRWIVFVVLAYIVGHVLHAFAGKLLDRPIYHFFYLHGAQPSHFRALRLVKNKQLADLWKDKDLCSTLYARALFRAGNDYSGTSLYDWCLSFIRLQSPAAAAEVDRCQADSKFFRSLAVVMLVAVMVSAAGGSPMAAGGSLLILIFSIWRFCVLRWEATKRVYEFYLLLHQYPSSKGGSSGALGETYVGELSPNKGVLFRGTVLSAGGDGKLVATAAGNEDKAFGVLLNAGVDTALLFDDGTVTGSVARAGLFKGQALRVPGGTDVAKLTAALRVNGIFVEGPIVPAAASAKMEMAATMLSADETTPAAPAPVTESGAPAAAS